jgi:hypothetical protein
MVSVRLHLQTPNTARQLNLESVANTFRDEPQPSGSSDARRRSSLEEFCERGQHVNITARSIHCPIHSGFENAVLTAAPSVGPPYRNARVRENSGDSLI